MPWFIIEGEPTLVPLLIAPIGASAVLVMSADKAKALGINPVGQSGVLFDAHYQDQAKAFMVGGYFPEHLADADVQAHTRSTLSLKPAASSR